MHGEKVWSTVYTCWSRQTTGQSHSSISENVVHYKNFVKLTYHLDVFYHWKKGMLCCVFLVSIFTPCARARGKVITLYICCPCHVCIDIGVNHSVDWWECLNFRIIPEEIMSTGFALVVQFWRAKWYKICCIAFTLHHNTLSRNALCWGRSEDINTLCAWPEIQQDGLDGTQYVVYLLTLILLNNNYYGDHMHVNKFLAHQEKYGDNAIWSSANTDHPKRMQRHWCMISHLIMYVCGIKLSYILHYIFQC